ISGFGARMSGLSRAFSGSFTGPSSSWTISWIAAWPRSSSSSSMLRSGVNFTPQIAQIVASRATGSSHIGRGTVASIVLAAFVLGFYDAPSGCGCWGGRLRGGQHNPHAPVGDLEESEGWIRRRVLEMKDADLPHDPIAAPGPFNLDDAVEGLVKGGELRPRVHLFVDQNEARELVAVELPLC